jgi:hypothetical protein
MQLTSNPKMTSTAQTCRVILTTWWSKWILVGRYKTNTATCGTYAVYPRYYTTVTARMHPSVITLAERVLFITKEKLILGGG